MVNSIHVIPTFLKLLTRWLDECRCDEAYTGRDMHEPNSKCGELDDLRVALKEIESILGEE